jgi:diguanylate cyclase (GGDEF)-like protein
MDRLVQASLLLRRIVRRGHGLALLGALATYVALGGANAPLGAVTVVAAFLWLFHLATRLARKVMQAGDAPLLVDVELGIALVIGLDAALLALEGSLSGLFSPAIYVLVALVATFARPVAGAIVMAFVVAFEAVIRFRLDPAMDLRALAPHAGFVLAFFGLQIVSTRAEIARVRVHARARLDQELTRLKADARSYRLLGAGEGNPDAEDRLARSSVEEIHASVHYALELLRRSLGLHTAVLLWLNDAGTHLRISELSTGSDDINDAPFAIGDGVLGAVVAKRERVALHSLKPSYKVPYYTSGCPVRVLLALPVLEEGALRGILALDRVVDAPFTPHEEEIAAQAARFCLRAIQNERVFVQLERAKVEQGKLYRAAKALASASREGDVLEAGVQAAREMASFDFAAITVFDEATRTHEICAVKGGDGELDPLVGSRFSHNAGLVSMVVQNRYPLPYRGELDAAHQVVLSRALSLPKVPSLLVLPLVMHGRALGTLILGARRKHAFGDAVRPTLELLASHLAVSLANARMVHKLETLATTDGLTGLLNKRAMLDEAKQKIAAAARFGRKLSVLVTDIDFFKKVNDTYGHDVGDVVIRGLGEILSRQKRTTDVVARFGGEEFVVLCEQTDEHGAELLAERIREELEKTTFRTANGPLHVTCSLGIATFPEAGADWDALFKSADEALYVSKRSGRNRVTVHGQKPRTSETRERLLARKRAG